jgi:hypothetical protein
MDGKLHQGGRTLTYSKRAKCKVVVAERAPIVLSNQVTAVGFFVKYGFTIADKMLRNNGTDGCACDKKTVAISH